MLKSAGYFFLGEVMSYNKPPRTYEEQLTILETRGLVVSDRAFALHCLEHYNYYRISAYRFTLTESGHPDQFLADTTFEQLWGLYCFDRNLLLPTPLAFIRVHSRFNLSSSPTVYPFAVQQDLT